MKVIVAGAPKTGTTSMAAALRELDYKVYDSEEQMTLQAEDWKKILIDGEDPSLHLKRMFMDVDAVTDGPGFCFWEQLLNAFPDAVVILLDRDEDRWAKSYKLQKEVEYRYRWMARFNREMRDIYQMADKTEQISMGSEHFVEYLYRWKFRLHNEKVRAVVPKEKLLKFSVKDGWEPLCQFLGKDVPKIPFPHVNQNADYFEQQFQQERNELIKNLSIKITGIVGVLVGSALVICRAMKRND